ncbi:Divalent metal cation transporter MntH [Coccomyxa sp. Obi]|nr:Divalent metal cation transporter MntH [Coccomyxa sp. Obi]
MSCWKGGKADEPTAATSNVNDEECQRPEAFEVEGTAASTAIDPSVEENVQLLKGWRVSDGALSLPEVNGSIKCPDVAGTWYAKAAAFAGLGGMIAVGYMDPGNWATDLDGGSLFGYKLLVVILLSNFAAMFLQSLALKLGVVAERDLAQACRDAYPKWLVYILWVLAEVAIAATDLAEIIGSATALNLLFNIPLWGGVLITAVDVLFILAFGMKNFRVLEALVLLLCATIFACFVYELAAVKPVWLDVAKGFIPRPEIITDPSMLYVAIGILGATVMPHNLYLHSSIIQTRAYPRTILGKKMAVRYGTWDSTLSLLVAFFINAAILILAAAAFYYGREKREVAYLSDAYRLLEPAVGSAAAKILFGVALLASGQNSTITGTLAGQVVMEGFLQIRLKPWVRRILTRMVAIIPAAVVAGVMGDAGAGKLLVLSQVILSLTLSAAVIPLVHFTCSKSKLGSFANGWIGTICAWLLAFVIAGLNGYLLISSIINNEFGSSSGV